MSATALRSLRGRTIVAVDPGAFRDGRGGWVFDPTFVLDDGSHVSFTVGETESLRYGLRVHRVRPSRR